MITGSAVVMHIYTNNIKHALASTQNDHILLQININRTIAWSMNAAS